MTREEVIAKVTEKATNYAQKQKYNEEQTKLYVEEKVNKALEKFDNKNKTNTNVVNPQNSGEETETSPENKNINVTTEEDKTKNKNITSTIEKEYTVYTPVDNFCGEVAGVQFAYGKATVKEGWILKWFIEKGYKVEEVR